MKVSMSLCKYLTFNLSGSKSLREIISLKSLLAFNEPETAQLLSGHPRALDFIVRVVECH